MWRPTHVQVTVVGARNLQRRGRNNTSDAYVTIELDRDRYQTSVREKTRDVAEWCEQCDLSLPATDKLTSVVRFNVYHRSFIGLDSFLGRLSLPLDQFNLYDTPQNRWYSLTEKSSKPSSKFLGEIELKIAFVVYSKTMGQKTINLSNIKRSSSIKSVAKEVGSKFKLTSRLKTLRSGSQSDLTSLNVSLLKTPLVKPSSETDLTHHSSKNKKKWFSYKDSTDVTDSVKSPIYKGTIPHHLSSKSFDDKSDLLPSPNSLNPINESGTETDVEKDCTDLRTLPVWSNDLDSSVRSESAVLSILHKNRKNNDRRHTLQSDSDLLSEPRRLERDIDIEQYQKANANSIPPEIVEKYSEKSREELITMLCKQKYDSERKESYIKDLEHYIDDLLVKVMLTQPRILQNPYQHRYDSLTLGRNSKCKNIVGKHNPAMSPVTSPLKKISMLLK